MNRIIATVAIGTAIVISSTIGGFVAQQLPPVSAAVQVPAGYVAVNPGRVFDSRGPSGTNARLGAGAQVTINSGQPGAPAVGVNVTMTDIAGGGYLTAWASGARPGTSVMNAPVAGESVANFLLIPVAADGTFQIFTLNPAHIIVDIMGYMAGGAALAPAGFTGAITGYDPMSTITSVVGDITNGTSATVSVRADVTCVDGSVTTDSTYSIPSGATRGWSVLCSGSFSTGATVRFIQV